MEETLSSIFYACKLARDLESNLPNLTNQPNLLASSCDEIATAFNGVIDRLNAHNPTSYSQMVFRDSQESRPLELEEGVQDWLKPISSQPVDLLQTQFFADKNPFDVRVFTQQNEMGMTQPSAAGLGLKIPVTSSGLKVLELGTEDMDYAGDAEASTRPRGGGEFQASEGSDSCKIPAAQRSRKRKDIEEKRTITAPAPRIGNTEIPPEDGFTWRKYGQKDILMSKFPRSYYRCTHKKLYGCNAKKQVQRLDDDPFTFEVTYFGNHRCLMSSTAPTVAPSAEVVGATQPPISTSIPLSRWMLSMGFEHKSSRAESNTPIDSHSGLYRNFNMGGGESNSGGGGEPGPSHTRDGKEMEYPVVNFADVMFNSGSSSNSMDAIFPCMQEK